MKRRVIPYSEAELRWIEGHRDWPRRQMHAAFVERFGRSDVSCENLKRLCIRKGWVTGRTGRFEKGQASPNAGKPMTPEVRAKIAHTWFRKGNRTGHANHLYKPIGFERVTDDGYLERKIHDGLPPQSRWRAVHLIRWEEVNGPLPEGHALKCLDGNRRNTDPANWEAIPRALLPRLAGRWSTPYDDAPDELKPTIMATAKLAHAAREAKRRKA